MKEEREILEEVMKISENLDSVRVIQFEESGVYLSVFPPQGKGKPITLDELLNEIEHLQVKDYDEEAIKKTVLLPTGAKIKIAPPQEEVKRDGIVKVDVSPDKLQAWLTVYPPLGGRNMNIQDCQNALKENQVVHGIMEEEVERALSLEQASQAVLIAKGEAAVNGKDAVIEYMFRNPHEQLKPKQLEDGNVDFYNLELITNATNGQVLAKKSPATLGTSGIDVTGTEIPPKPGKDIPLKKGQNVEVVDEGKLALATTDGQVVIKDNTIHVLPIYEHKGDVDFSSGNLDFLGSIIVRGSVKNGFTVKAQGDVEIFENVEAANIQAGGNIQVKKGIQGRGKGSLKAAGDIFAKFIESSTVESEQTVYSEAIMHSNIMAQKNIVLSGKKGLIVGGKCLAGESITAKVIGSELGTITTLEVGINPQIRLEYNEVKSKIKELEESFDKTCKALKLLKKLEEQTCSFSDEKKMMLLRVMKTHQQLDLMLQQLLEKKINIEQKISQLKDGKVEVKSFIYPGVSVTIGRSIMNVRDELKSIVLIEEAGDIRVAPFSPAGN